ncbi:MAG: hypothetical protein DRI95_14780 [Bacteroidetes bacterium]|nr:MAG: hypothetical protein DRI95_14780 [Bacteroidota bacterium]
MVEKVSIVKHFIILDAKNDSFKGLVNDLRQIMILTVIILNFMLLNINYIYQINQCNIALACYPLAIPFFVSKAHKTSNK